MLTVWEIPVLSIFKFDGIVICVSDEQYEKALFPIDVTDDGIVICVSDEQCEKAKPLMILMVGGMFAVLISHFTERSVS